MSNNININSSRQILIIYILLAVITLAVFWQVNQYEFINFDDNIYVTENSYVQSGITPEGIRWAFSTRYSDLWNPLIWISFMFDHQLNGLKAGGYHLTNLILHIMSVLLLFWLFLRMTGAIWKSAFIAGIFAFHPMQVESVAWIAERKDVLSGLFWMLTLCLYVYYTEKPILRRYLPVLLSFACALMSKPMVITLPVIMILLDYWPLSQCSIGIQSREISTNASEITRVFEEQWKQQTTSKRNKETLKANTPSSNDQKIPQMKKIAGIIPSWQLWEKIPYRYLQKDYISGSRNPYLNFVGFSLAAVHLLERQFHSL